MGLLNFLFKKQKNHILPKTTEMIKREWKTIEDLLKGRQPSQLRQALISADKTLDNALRDLVLGENMGERLKSGENLFDKGLYNRIWEAHKLRNSLVHESGFEVSSFILIENIQQYKKALNSLGIGV